MAWASDYKTMTTVTVTKPPHPKKQQNGVTWLYTPFQRKSILEVTVWL